MRKNFLHNDVSLALKKKRKEERKKRVSKTHEKHS
jgi:hypothetical protein